MYFLYGLIIKNNIVYCLLAGNEGLRKTIYRKQYK